MYRWLLICNILGWPSGVDHRGPSGYIPEHSDRAGMHVPSTPELPDTVTGPVTCPFGKERYCG